MEAFIESMVLIQDKGKHNDDDDNDNDDDDDDDDDVDDNDDENHFKACMVHFILAEEL